MNTLRLPRSLQFQAAHLRIVEQLDQKPFSCLLDRICGLPIKRRVSPAVDIRDHLAHDLPDLCPHEFVVRTVQLSGHSPGG